MRIILFCFVLLVGCQSKQLRFEGGAVASDHPLASQAGVAILEQGGNAVDAAVATSFALSVVRPFSCGIGGGGFMLIASDDIKPIALNYRETAPRNSSPSMYQNHSSVLGPFAVGVPGTVAGLLDAHERFGTLPREVVLAPAIKLARQGFMPDDAYNRALSNALDVSENYKEALGTLFDQQELIILSGQALAFEQIAAYGKAGFYEGKVAEAIVRATDGWLTLEDLKDYEPVWVEPIVSYKLDGMSVLTMPPPSSGGVAIGQVLSIMERLNAFDYELHSPTYCHLYVESSKHAFADRAEHMADPMFSNVPVSELLNADYLDELALLVDVERTQEPSDYGSQSQLPDDSGTSHVCVADSDGMVVAMTETINTHFGSKVIVEPYGFVLNNEMDDFSSPKGANAYGLVQSEKNFPEHGKRPLSSMTPVIVMDGEQPIFLVGASGGPRIISSVLQVLIHRLWYGMSPMDAIALERLHHQWTPNAVYVESYKKSKLPLNALEAKGHEIKSRRDIGIVQAIAIEDGVQFPASDPRKGGKPAGLN